MSTTRAYRAVVRGWLALEILIGVLVGALLIASAIRSQHARPAPLATRLVAHVGWEARRTRD